MDEQSGESKEEEEMGEGIGESEQQLRHRRGTARRDGKEDGKIRKVAEMEKIMSRITEGTYRTYFIIWNVF